MKISLLFVSHQEFGMLKQFDNCSFELIPVTKDGNPRTLSRRGLFDFLEYQENKCLLLNALHWNRKVLYTIASMETARESNVLDTFHSLSNKVLLRVITGKAMLGATDHVYKHMVSSLVSMFLDCVTKQNESYDLSDMVECGKESIIIGLFIKLLNEGTLNNDDMLLWKYIGSPSMKKFVSLKSSKDLLNLDKLCDDLDVSSDWKAYVKMKFRVDLMRELFSICRLNMRLLNIARPDGEIFDDGPTI